MGHYPNFNPITMKETINKHYNLQKNWSHKYEPKYGTNNTEENFEIKQKPTDQTLLHQEANPLGPPMKNFETGRKLYLTQQRLNKAPKDKFETPVTTAHDYGWAPQQFERSKHGNKPTMTNMVTKDLDGQIATIHDNDHPLGSSLRPQVKAFQETRPPVEKIVSNKIRHPSEETPETLPYPFNRSAQFKPKPKLKEAEKGFPF
mmetsp:Transcript_10810/g.15832  ORF Transcript_10810/g.15832 Transcript_10810/m.15832 type:complete len:203 (+) Transcript_10810:21-629(+)